MKTIKTILALVALSLFAFTFTNCSSDDNDENPASTEDLFIKFTINNSQENYTGINLVSADGGSGMSVNGNNGEDSNSNDYILISLQFPDTGVTTGTFDFGNTPFESDDHECNLTYQGVHFLKLSTGSITVTGIDGDEFTGTFSGTGTKDGVSVTITNGSFRAILL